MIERITIHVFDKTRALYLADYLMHYGNSIWVTQVVISIHGICRISLIGDKTDVTNLVYQFHEDY